jgi:hypothetical protein
MPQPTLLFVKAPADKDVLGVNWTDYLKGAGIAQSTWAITNEAGGASDGQLTTDNPVVAGGMATARVLAGTIDVNYRLVNHMTTNESPPREKDAVILVAVRLNGVL